jgi:primase-polymerase (primpol)-like protein
MNTLYPGAGTVNDRPGEVGRLAALPVLVEHIPAELRGLSRWLGWVYSLRDGRWTKPPVCVRTGGAGSSTDPSTWVSWAEALAAYQHGGLDGLGFALAADERDPLDLIGLDLDKVRDPDTGVIEPGAQGAVLALGTYAEVSPSRRGLRALWWGALPAGCRCRRGHVEVYQQGRYLTTTGHPLPGAPATIARPDPDAVAGVLRGLGLLEVRGRRDAVPPPPGRPPRDLPDEQLLARALRSRSGPRLGALWGGDWSAYPSPSEGDLALCLHLAWWTGGDAARVDRLYRQSGLYRAKWDQRHAGDGRTYGRLTVERALALVRGGYDPRPRQRRGGHRLTIIRATVEVY